MTKIKSIKMFALGFVTCLLLTGVIAVAATGVIRSAQFNDVSVVFNGEELELNMPLVSIILEGQDNIINYMPVRAVLEGMGYVVDWDGVNGRVLVSGVGGSGVSGSQNGAGASGAQQQVGGNVGNTDNVVGSDVLSVAPDGFRHQSFAITELRDNYRLRINFVGGTVASPNVEQVNIISLDNDGNSTGNQIAITSEHGVLSVVYDGGFEGRRLLYINKGLIIEVAREHGLGIFADE